MAVNHIAGHVLDTTLPTVRLAQGTIVQSKKGDWAWWTATGVMVAGIGLMVWYPKAYSTAYLVVSAWLGLGVN